MTSQLERFTVLRLTFLLVLARVSEATHIALHLVRLSLFLLMNLYGG